MAGIKRQISSIFATVIEAACSLPPVVTNKSAPGNNIHLIINAIMDDCGMARLDMRNAFDWLILYATATQGDEAMSERLEAVIAELYG